MAVILDGKACSKVIEEELKAEIELLKISPKLVLILVGNNSDSSTYVRMKKKACERVGIEAVISTFPADVTYDELSNYIIGLNGDEDVNGILLQLPLPRHLQSHEEELLHSIDQKKDVDGLHPNHMHALLKRQKNDSTSVLRLFPCTPAGCIEILTRNGISIHGKDVVVVGRGMLVGMPLSLMLLQLNATVTVCHSHTQNLKEKVANADIVFVATGQPKLVKGDWIKQGAVIVDVGINYVDDPSSKKGYTIFGDVEYKEAKARSAAITPVPGGIGPMTIALLLKNTVSCAKFAHRIPS
jgi:5,10-methylene-tetrahydrofolate dehydrogenase/methenyl tetrahydrofolate cyclohydrolase